MGCEQVTCVRSLTDLGKLFPDHQPAVRVSATQQLDLIDFIALPTIEKLRYVSDRYGRGPDDIMDTKTRLAVAIIEALQMGEAKKKRHSIRVVTVAPLNDHGQLIREHVSIYPLFVALPYTYRLGFIRLHRRPRL